MLSLAFHDDGVTTGILGFIKTLQLVLRSLEPDTVAIPDDSGSNHNKMNAILTVRSRLRVTVTVTVKV